MPNHALNQTPGTARGLSEFITQLYHGEIPLVFTFWVFGVGGQIVFILLGYFFYRFSSLLTVMFIVDVVYSIFMLIAIWRSAINYKSGNGWFYGFWGDVARVIVIINAILFVGIILIILTAAFA